MPNYLFKCEGCGREFDWTCKVDERDEPLISPCCMKKNAWRVFTPAAGISIPNYMKAAGSKESSEEANDRQRAYLNSPEWKAKREDIERKGGTVKVGGNAGL